MEELFVKGGPLAAAAGFVLFLVLSGRVLTKGHHDAVVAAVEARCAVTEVAVHEMTRDRDYWREQTMLLLPTTREAIQVAERRRRLDTDPEGGP